MERFYSNVCIDLDIEQKNMIKKLDNCTSLSLYILFVGFQQDMAKGGIIVEDLI